MVKMNINKILIYNVEVFVIKSYLYLNILSKNFVCNQKCVPKNYYCNAQINIIYLLKHCIQFFFLRNITKR